MSIIAPVGDLAWVGLALGAVIGVLSMRDIVGCWSKSGQPA